MPGLSGIVNEILLYSSEVIHKMLIIGLVIPYNLHYRSFFFLVFFLCDRYYLKPSVCIPGHSLQYRTVLIAIESFYVDTFYFIIWRIGKNPHLLPANFEIFIPGRSNKNRQTQLVV